MQPILLCVIAVAGLLIAERRGSPAGLWLTKPVASAAFIWLGLESGALDSGYGQLVLAGLVLCMLGDLLLIPLGRPAIFRAGLFAFLLGHVAYSAAFATRPLAPIGLVAGGMALAAFIYLVLRWLGRSVPADMVVPVRAYMVVIGVMSTLACAVTAAGGPGRRRSGHWRSRHPTSPWREIASCATSSRTAPGACRSTTARSC